MCTYIDNRTRPHKESEHKRNPSGSNGSIESETSKLRPNPRDEEVNENGIQNNDKINPTGKVFSNYRHVEII